MSKIVISKEDRTLHIIMDNKRHNLGIGGDNLTFLFFFNLMLLQDGLAFVFIIIIITLALMGERCIVERDIFT